MNYKIAHAEDGSIQLTMQQPNVFSRPVPVNVGERHPETGWTFEELKILGEHESYDLKQKVPVLIVSKEKNAIIVRPNAVGSMDATETVNKTGQGGEGRHAYSGLTFSELAVMDVGKDYWVERQ